MFSKHDLHEAMNLSLGHYPVDMTPQKMRIGLARAAHGNVVLRTLSMTADQEGWSGEDKFVAIAFYLLLHVEVLEDVNLRRLTLEAHPAHFVSQSDLQRIDGHLTACDPPFIVGKINGG